MTMEACTKTAKNDGTEEILQATLLRKMKRKKFTV
jgi:hypothetical protein